MNGLLLFARLRRWPTNVVVAVCSAVAIVVAGPLRYALNPADGYLVAVVAQIPLVSAVVAVASSMSPVADRERLAARPLRARRALHHVALTAVVGGVLGLGASALVVQQGPVPGAGIGALAVVRDFCAMTGAGFIGASVLGPAFGWTVPAAWTILPYVLLTQTTQEHRLLALAMQPDDSFAAFAIACVVWAVGLVLATAARADVVDLPRALLRAASRVVGR